MACFVVVTDVQPEIRPEVTGKVWKIVEPLKDRSGTGLRGKCNVAFNELHFPFLGAAALSQAGKNCTLAEHST
jgi:hypothetical protein